MHNTDSQPINSLEAQYPQKIWSPWSIGAWQIAQPTVLAPMAGVTDEPFRELCEKLGAGLTVSEMVTSDERLWSSKKSQRRLISAERLKESTQQPLSIQLAGNDREMMASAAKANVKMGAQIIDINMGCPAKKVCKKAAGSALLRDEPLVASILQAVVAAVDVPVTLKIRTGWSPEERNGVTIARMAEDIGIQALTVHGRTRSCAFKGEAEYDTIADIVQAVNIPVIANGDITTPEKAQEVINYTQADAVMIGRGAQGNPWIFEQINAYLTTGATSKKPDPEEICRTILWHVKQLHKFYGELMGARISRKHIGWYLKHQFQDYSQESLGQENQKSYEQFRQEFNRINSAVEQLQALQQFFTQSQFTKELEEEIAA